MEECFYIKGSNLILPGKERIVLKPIRHKAIEILLTK